MSNDCSPDDDRSVGYRKPPLHSRFQKGQSGNPRGRPKKKPTFLDDAVSILGAPVTGQIKGRQVKMAAEQGLYRRLCHNALTDSNAALRWVINLVLVLEPEALQEAEENNKANDQALRKIRQMAGLDPDKINDTPKEPSPEFVEWGKRADELANVERKRLLREAKEQGRI